MLETGFTDGVPPPRDTGLRLWSSVPLPPGASDGASILKSVSKLLYKAKIAHRRHLSPPQFTSVPRRGTSTTVPSPC